MKTWWPWRHCREMNQKPDTELCTLVMIMTFYSSFHQEDTKQSNTGCLGGRAVFCEPWFYPSIIFYKPNPPWDLSLSYVPFCFLFCVFNFIVLFTNNGVLNNEFRNILLCGWLINQSIYLAFFITLHCKIISINLLSYVCC